MANGGERSAEEREAARRERERRRNGRFDGARPSSDGEAELHPPAWVSSVQNRMRIPRIGSSSRSPRASRVRRPGRAERPPGNHSRRNRVAALVALVVAAVVVWFSVEVFQPFHGSGHGRVTVVIPPHSGVGKVASLLSRAGVIGSSFFFEVRATIDGDRSDLRAGTYNLKLDMSYGDVLRILTTPPPPAPVTGVTIIPGRTRRQIDRLLRSQGVKGSYYAGTRSSSLLDPRTYGAPAGTDSLEGFLFPDTYQVRAPVTISGLVDAQLEDFKRQFQTVNMSYARSHGLTPYDVVIIGSMVEGEAQTAHDRPLVASVIYNRLRQGIPLGIDATTCYLSTSIPCKLTPALLNSSSPYNTRNHRGLPPTPIGNPGLLAIRAAAHPANTNYLYFVNKVCGNGALQFTANYQQFLVWQQQYLTARAHRGGNSPANC